MSLAVPWLAFPAVLALLCVGVGLLVERAGATRLPGALLAPLGFAGLVAATQLTLMSSSTARATIPVVVVLAVAGYVVGWARVRAQRPDPWTVALAVAVYAIFAAPAALWGGRTFLGYGNLGDAAIHFELVDRLLEHGPTIDGLPESSYMHSLSAYFQTAYPTGGHGVLGAVRGLLGTDVAWLFQPFLSCLAALAALAVVPLARELTTRRPLAAAAAAVAVLAAPVYGYAVGQEAIKELGAVVSLILLAALVPPLVRTPPHWRTPIPLAVAAAGGLGVLSLALAPWLGPLLVVAVVALALRTPRAQRGRLAAAVAVFAGVGLLLAIPRLTHLDAFVQASNVVLTAQQELGNLQRPLDFIFAFGVWPTPDFRLGLPPQEPLALALVGASVIAAVFGLAAVARRRAWGVALFVLVSLIGFAVVAGRASPWAYGKTLMILAPALALLGAAGAVGLWEVRRRWEGGVLLVALLCGVLWSDALAYHNVDAAPTERLEELASIGERFDGKGPLVYFEFDEYAKHFLRDTDPTGVVEGYRPAFPASEPGTGPRFGFSSDVGDWTPQSLAEHFKLVAVRQGPTASRPPAGWSRAFHGRYYDVWRRDADAPAVTAQLRLGGRLDAAGTARCADVRRLARQGRQLAFAERPRVVAFRTTQHGTPANWVVDPGDPDVFRPVGPGRVGDDVRVRPGRYDVWLEASVGRAATVRIDGRPVGSMEDQMNPRLSATKLGSVELEGGRHTVSVELGGGDLEPGNGGFNRLLGPVYLVPAADDVPPVRTIPASQWRLLCGRHLDWVQALA
jgi:hypothetical protein